MSSQDFDTDVLESKLTSNSLAVIFAYAHDKSIEIEYTWQGEDGYYECDWCAGVLKYFSIEEDEGGGYYYQVLCKILDKNNKIEDLELYFYVGWKIFGLTEDKKQIYRFADSETSDRYVSLTVFI